MNAKHLPATPRGSWDRSPAEDIRAAARLAQWHYQGRHAPERMTWRSNDGLTYHLPRGQIAAYWLMPWPVWGGGV